MVIELKDPPAMSLLVLNVAALVGKIRSSSGMAEPVGATPVFQLAASLQLLSGPPPIHVKVAGAKRVSRCSRCKARRPRFGLRSGFTRGRNSERNQRAHEN